MKLTGTECSVCEATLTACARELQRRSGDSYTHLELAVVVTDTGSHKVTWRAYESATTWTEPKSSWEACFAEATSVEHLGKALAQEIEKKQGEIKALEVRMASIERGKVGPSDCGD